MAFTTFTNENNHEDIVSSWYLADDRPSKIIRAEKGNLENLLIHGGESGELQYTVQVVQRDKKSGFFIPDGNPYQPNMRDHKIYSIQLIGLPEFLKKHNQHPPEKSLVYQWLSPLPPNQPEPPITVVV